MALLCAGSPIASTPDFRPITQHATHSLTLRPRGKGIAMPPPRLSVIMTVRNGAEHIEEAIGSILGQTFNDFEFLIVDDGSDDATPDILARYAKADGRIRLI